MKRQNSIISFHNGWIGYQELHGRDNPGRVSPGTLNYLNQPNYNSIFLKFLKAMSGRNSVPRNEAMDKKQNTSQQKYKFLPS